jgi:hypothetical protein
MRSRTAVALLVLAALVPACGKKGDIQPPLVLRPQPAESLTAIQRGGGVRLEWTNPTTATDGKPLAGLAAIEIWLEVRSDPPPPAALAPKGDFVSRARRVGSVVPAAGAPTSSWTYAIDPAGWRSRLFAFAVRARETLKNRLSEFSNEAVLKPQAVPLPPVVAQTGVHEDRIEIRWTASPKNFDGSDASPDQGTLIYRAEENGVPGRLTPLPVRGTVYQDKDFVFGTVYRYVLRATTTATASFLESEDSVPFEIKPIDTFPPAAPAGVSIAAGPDFLTLVWDANAEKDLAGYHVWRRTGGTGEFVRLTAAPILESAYADRSVEKNKVYEYAMTAVDAAGNVSPRSAVVSEIIKEH